MFTTYGPAGEYRNGSSTLPPNHKVEEGGYLEYVGHVYMSGCRKPILIVKDEKAKGTAKAMPEIGHYFIEANGTDTQSVKNVIHKLEIALGAFEVLEAAEPVSEEGITKPTTLAEAMLLMEKVMAWVTELTNKANITDVFEALSGIDPNGDLKRGIDNRLTEMFGGGLSPEAMAALFEEIERDDDLGLNPDRDFEWSDQV